MSFKLPPWTTWVCNFVKTVQVILHCGLMIHSLALAMLTLLVMFSPKCHLTKPGVTNTVPMGTRSTPKDCRPV